jgi:predicted nucleotidyltransferase component of viral defense system
MTPSYSNAVSFRQALEARIGSLAAERGIPGQKLRLKIAIERLLARLFASNLSPWLLKGGYSLELRFHPQARTTRDVDLAIEEVVPPDRLKQRLSEVHEQLQVAAAAVMKDYFEFEIGPAKDEIQGAIGVFGVVAFMAGREFVRFHLDLGFAGKHAGASELLEGENLLEFAGIAPAKARAISKEQQFAEKIHAYTYEWTGRQNTRSKDLVDLVLLIERGKIESKLIRHALEVVFEGRAKQMLPAQLNPPPDSWETGFELMAREAGISVRNPKEAFKILDEYWRRQISEMNR